MYMYIHTHTYICIYCVRFSINDIFLCFKKISSLNMTNNLYTLYFQNWYDTMINLDISVFFNNTENYYRMKMGDMIYSYFPSVENS